MSPIITQDEREAIRCRCQKATPGPWHIGVQNDNLYIVDRPPEPSNDYPQHDADREVIARIFQNGRGGGYEQESADAAFIAHAREDVPRLFDAYKAAEARILELETECSALAAGLCIHEGYGQGLYGDDWGHSCCWQAEENERLREKLKAAGARTEDANDNAQSAQTDYEMAISRCDELEDERQQAESERDALAELLAEFPPVWAEDMPGTKEDRKVNWLNWAICRVQVKQAAAERGCGE